MCNGGKGDCGGECLFLIHTFLSIYSIDLTFSLKHLFINAE